MKKQLLFFALCSVICALCFAAPMARADISQSLSESVSQSEPAGPTCAQNVFANALQSTMSSVSESDPEYMIRGWIYQSFGSADTIKQVLSCPEFANAPDDEMVAVPTVAARFPGGREIKIGYETQPKILKHKIAAANKKSLPTFDPSPRVGAPEDPAIWTNTEPAWYGILVVQSGALNDFVGPGKNNTLSLKYLEKNIDKFYPRGAGCTSKSALASDNDTINKVMHKTVDLQDDTNDYYIAGDANLQWITWSEVALDVAITVVTMGGGAVVLGATKAARATKAAKGLIGVMRTLEKSDKVKDFIKMSRNAEKLAEELKTIDKVTDAAKFTAKTDELKNATDALRGLEKIDDVKKYKTAASGFEDVMKMRRALKGVKIAQRGNVIARAWRAGRASFTGGKTLAKASKVGRASTLAGRTRDLLFRTTLKNAGRVAKVAAATGMVYGVMKFAGDMYDWSETSTGDFTSNIEFTPLGLLSADDLAGQENVVNHGMWIMWAGDSMDPADDDSAYLQAMDTTAKFHQDLIEAQEDAANNSCDVDIFVVRPIIRNPGDPDAELFYLIMNDEPWGTDKR